MQSHVQILDRFSVLQRFAFERVAAAPMEATALNTLLPACLPAAAALVQEWEARRVRAKRRAQRRAARVRLSPRLV